MRTHWKPGLAARAAGSIREFSMRFEIRPLRAPGHQPGRILFFRSAQDHWLKKNNPVAFWATGLD